MKQTRSKCTEYTCAQRVLDVCFMFASSCKHPISLFITIRGPFRKFVASLLHLTLLTAVYLWRVYSSVFWHREQLSDAVHVRRCYN